MTGDIEKLQEGLVDQVRDNIIALTRQAYDDRERYDLSMKAEDAKIKLGASMVEKICLKEALGQANAEQERLCVKAVDLCKKYQVVASGETIAGIVLFERQ